MRAEAGGVGGLRRMGPFGARARRHARRNGIGAIRARRHAAAPRRKLGTQYKNAPCETRTRDLGLIRPTL